MKQLLWILAIVIILYAGYLFISRYFRQQEKQTENIKVEPINEDYFQYPDELSGKG